MDCHAVPTGAEERAARERWDSGALRGGNYLSFWLWILPDCTSEVNALRDGSLRLRRATVGDWSHMSRFLLIRYTFG